LLKDYIIWLKDYIILLKDYIILLKDYIILLKDYLFTQPVHSIAIRPYTVPVTVCCDVLCGGTMGEERGTSIHQLHQYIEAFPTIWGWSSKNL
jgi:hypothetical protein